MREQDYWLQIAQAFPDAKVVYTNRDGQQWLASMRSALEAPYVLNQWHYIATFWFPALRKGLKVGISGDWLGLACITKRLNDSYMRRLSSSTGRNMRETMEVYMPAC